MSAKCQKRTFAVLALERPWCLRGLRQHLLRYESIEDGAAIAVFTRAGCRLMFVGSLRESL